MLLVANSSMLLQARCHCTSGVGVCGRMWSGQYIIESTYSVCCCVIQRKVMCVVHVKSFIGCTWIWLVRYVGDCGVCVVGKMSNDIGMGAHKGTVVSCVPTLFGYFLGIPSLYAFSFF